MTRNIVNIDDVEAFIRALADAAADPRLADYLVIALKKSILKEDRFFKMVEDYPDPAPDWLTPEKVDAGVMAFNRDLATGSTDTFRHIKDWIAGALNDNDPWINNLDNKNRPKTLLQISSLENARVRADKAMALKVNKLQLEFANATNNFESDEAAGHIKTIKILDDGSRIVQLLTARALDIESAQLGHCIGNGGYDEQVAQPEIYQYYSLRSPSNKVHATLEVENGTLTQCKGKQNAPPIEKYFTPLQDFIREHKWKLTEGAGHTGLLEKNGVYYAVNNLPKNFEWEGNLDIRYAQWLTHLSENLSAGGSLYLEGCTSLTYLPANLSVGGYLDLTGCTSLTSLPENLSVGGDLDLIGCTSLTSLSENFSVGVNLYLTGCTSLTSLPENLSVGRDLSLSGCTSLTNLPENLSVGGYLYLTGCTSLTSLPENLSVEGKIFWNDKVYKTVDDFRTAFEKLHPPQPVQETVPPQATPPAPSTPKPSF